MKKETNYLEIATKFKNELAARYSLPELRGAPMAEVKQRADWRVITTGLVNVEPTGQAAGIIKSMTASVSVDITKDGYVTGCLRYAYEHHSRGSNGCEHDFVLVLDEDILGDRTEYFGCLDVQLLHAHQVSERRKANRKNL